MRLVSSRSQQADHDRCCSYLRLRSARLLALQRMPVDIFPKGGDPAIYVAQPYGGMDPAQMEGYLTYYYEYHFLYITGIDHVESKSIQGAHSDEADVLRGHRHEPGNGGDDRLCEPRPRLYAARNRSAFRHAFRRGKRRRGTTGVQQRGAHTGRAAGLRDESRPAAVCNSARGIRSAAVWREPANHRHYARSGQAAPVSDLSRRGDRRRQQG